MCVYCDGGRANLSACMKKHKHWHLCVSAVCQYLSSRTGGGGRGGVTVILKTCRVACWYTICCV